LIGVAQEADLVSPGFKQSRVISNHSTLDNTLHCGEQRIVLRDGASGKRLCSSSVPPDDDDDDDDDDSLSQVTGGVCVQVVHISRSCNEDNWHGTMVTCF